MSSKSVQAQITLQATDYTPLLPHTDTVRISRYDATIPALPQGAAQTWDLSSFTDSVDLLPIYRVPAAGHSFADSITSSFIGFPLQYNQNYNITDSGIYYTSRAYAAASYNISARTVGAFDSLHFLTSTILPTSFDYSPRLPLLHSAAWHVQTAIDMNFEVSVQVYGYMRTPCIMRAYREAVDSTTGYGVLAVKALSGGRSDFWDVLQVSEREVTIDSYYLSGAPMPGALTTLLGITQGKTDTLFTQQYYRIGELTPLAKVWYTNSTYTRAYRAITHTQRLSGTSVPAATSQRTSVAVFPNPAVNGSVTVSGLPLGHYYCTIHSPTGLCIASNWLSVLDRAALLTLPQLPTGSYFLAFSQYHSISTYQCTVVIP
jgi:hypothetical protein